jgi:divalent metal cation (Fe/Co/Zn/Cd) transporter
MLKSVGKIKFMRSYLHRQKRLSQAMLKSAACLNRGDIVRIVILIITLLLMQVFYIWLGPLGAMAAGGLYRHARPPAG